MKGLGNLASPIDAANSDRNQRSETGNGPSETGSEPSETGMEQNLLAPNTSDVLLVVSTVEPVYIYNGHFGTCYFCKRGSTILAKP